MENRYKISFDIKTSSINDISFKQGDIESSVIEVSLTDGILPVNITDEVIEFRFLKADETIVFQDISTGVSVIDAVTGKFQCILKLDTLSAPGILKCEIYRSLNGKSLTTQSFNLTVNSSIGEEGLISNNYIGAIETIKANYEIATHENTDVEIVDARAGNINLGARLNLADASLAKKAKQLGKNCEELNMTPNDPLKAGDNYTKLTQAILDGYKVVVENTYYVGTTTPTTLNVDVVIEGVNKDSQLILTNTGNYYVLTGQEFVVINGLKLTKSDVPAGLVFLFTATETTFIKKLSVENCEFVGNLSLIRHKGSETVNPNITTYGYETFNFSNNKVKNAEASFIVIDDCPCREVAIRNNTVINFSQRFIASQTSNLHTFSNEIRASKKLCIVQNNYVKCEDDWYGIAGNGAYYVFILFEGVKTVYTGNWVEGVKSIDAIAVYDIYVGGDELHYYNNTWINNLCYSPEKTYNELMKAKDVKKRHYHNNTFIVEKEHVLALGQPLSNAWVTLFAQTSQGDSISIQNNLFRMYSLKFNQSGSPITNVNIHGNVFESDYYSFALLNYQVNDIADYTNSNITITYNSFKTNISESNNFHLLYITDTTVSGDKKPKNVNVQNNIIENCNGTISYNTTGENVIIKNNVLQSNEDSTGYVGLLTGEIKTNNIIIDGNYITCSSRLRDLYSKIGNFDYEGENKYRGKYTTKATRVSLFAYDTTAVKRNIIVENEILTSSMYKKFAINFSYGYDILEDRNYITFINTSDIETTIYFNRNDGIDTYLTGDITPIKVINLNAFNTLTSTATVRITTGENYIDFTDGIGTDEIINLKRMINCRS